MAGRAHDVMALCTRGPTAVLNFPAATYDGLLHLLPLVSGVRPPPAATSPGPLAPKLLIGVVCLHSSFSERY